MNDTHLRTRIVEVDFSDHREKGRVKRNFFMRKSEILYMKVWEATPTTRAKYD